MCLVVIPYTSGNLLRAMHPAQRDSGENNFLFPQFKFPSFVGFKNPVENFQRREE